MRRLKKSAPLAGLIVLALATLGIAGFALFRHPEQPRVSDAVANYTPAPQPTHEFMPAVGFLGDSYTAGDGATSKAVRWTTLLSAKRGWAETNAGFGGTGYGTAGRLAGGQPYDARVAQATTGVADAAHPIIIVSGGRNDLSEKTAAAEIAAGVTGTFTDLRKAAPKAKIVALSPLWDDDKAPVGLDAIGQEVRAAVESVGGQYVDLGQPLAGRADLIGPDGVHPNDAGYAYLAEKIDAALPKNLS